MRPPVLTAILLVALGTSRAEVEYDGRVNVRLRHALGPDGAFTDRGEVTIRSLRSGGSTLEQASLAPAEVEALKRLAAADDFYRLKAIVRGSDGREDAFLSSIKSSALLEGGLRDSISIWVVHDGSVAAVGASPAVAIAGADPPKSERDDEFSFSSRVFVHHVEQAPVPDTASYIQKLEREREAREKGETKDNRSFLAKYVSPISIPTRCPPNRTTNDWMYIVPAVIFILISGAANPEQGATR